MKSELKRKTGAQVIMLNNVPQLVILSTRSKIAPIVSKLRTAHFKELLKGFAPCTRVQYQNRFNWSIVSVDYKIIDE